MSFSASQALPFDNARCDNGHRCQHRDICLRWLSRDHTGPRTPFSPFFNGKVADTGKCFDILPIDPYRPPAFLMTPDDWASVAITRSNDPDLSFEESRKLRVEAKRYLILSTRIRDLELELKKLKDPNLGNTKPSVDPDSDTTKNGDPDGHAPQGHLERGIDLVVPGQD